MKNIYYNLNKKIKMFNKLQVHIYYIPNLDYPYNRIKLGSNIELKVQNIRVCKNIIIEKKIVELDLTQ